MDAPYIAVIDHDAAFLDFMRDLLTGEGYRAACWHAGDDVFARLKAARPMLAIVDIAAGNRDAAWELLERIHSDPATAPIPVIICTADIVNVRERAPDLLKYNYTVVEKPFLLEDMLTRIRDMLAPSPSKVDRTIQ